MGIDVSIIILNYNTPELTAACVQSIVAHTSGIDYEIILVDNGSSPESMAYFDEHLLFIPQLTIISEKENHGFGGGNNIGYKNSKGAYLFFLNSDTIFFENSLKILYDMYRTKEEFSKVGFLVPKLYLDATKTKKQLICAKVPTLRDIFITYIPGMKYFFSKRYKSLFYHDRDRESDREVGTSGGPAFLCSRKCFEDIGKFDERFFLYMEEFDMAKRLKKLGYHSFFTTKTSIIHLENQSPKQTYKKRLISLASIGKFIRKYM